MVPSELIREGSIGGLLVFLGCWSKGRYSVPDQQVDNGQNSQEIWEGIPAVLLFGDDYQLWPVIEEGAIQGYSKMTTTTHLAPTNKQSAAQLLCQWGTYLFVHVMTESVFILNKNYRVKSEEFQD